MIDNPTYSGSPKNLNFTDLGDSTGFKTFKIPALTIRYLHFAPFSNMSKGHKISPHGRISALLQIVIVLN
jgi:hypothetical protein